MAKFKHWLFPTCTVLLLSGLSPEVVAQNKMKRKDLLEVALPKQAVSSVKVMEIKFPAGQAGPYHQHPCPVMGYILEGTCLLQVEGQPPQILKAGDAFYEPAHTSILHFDNHSATQPLRFLAYYLLNGEKELLELLPKKD